MKQAKYRIYIDEVGNPDLKSSKQPDHRYLSLTGVIFDLNYVKNTLFPHIEALKTKYFNSHPDSPIILHRKELVNKSHPFKALKNPEVSAAFNSELLDRFKEWDFTVITVVIDKYEHDQRYSVWKYDPYHYCMEIIVERFYNFLTDRRGIGDVMVESRGKKEDQRLKKSFTRIYENGTSFIRDDYLKKVLTSKELKLKPKSANVAGLQIADLVAFPSRRYILLKYGHLTDNRRTFNDEIMEILREKYFRKGTRLDGWGMKWLP